MIFQYESQKRKVAIISGKHGVPDDDTDVFMSNTNGDFDPPPVDEVEYDDEEDPAGFGFRPQHT